MKSLIYLAVPYSDPNEHIRAYRFEMANLCAAQLMREGLHIFSPISHTHPIALAGDLPIGWEFWRAYDEAILRACKGLLVLKIDGWEQSKGVRGELDIANALGLRTRFIIPTRHSDGWTFL